MTYLFFLRDLFLAPQLDYKDIEIFLVFWIHIYALVWTIQNLLGLFKCIITIRSAIGYNILPELFHFGQIGIHADDICQQILGLKMEPFWVLDFEFETFSCAQLIKTKVQSLSKFLAKLFRYKRFLTMRGHFGHQLDDHVTKLETWFGCPGFIVKVLFGLVSLLLIKLIPFVVIFAY